MGKALSSPTQRLDDGGRTKERQAGPEHPDTHRPRRPGGNRTAASSQQRPDDEGALPTPPAGQRRPEPSTRAPHHSGRRRSHGPPPPAASQPSPSRKAAMARRRTSSQADPAGRGPRGRRTGRWRPVPDAAIRRRNSARFEVPRQLSTAPPWLSQLSAGGRAPAAGARPSTTTPRRRPTRRRPVSTTPAPPRPSTAPAAGPTVAFRRGKAHSLRWRWVGHATEFPRAEFTPQVPKRRNLVGSQATTTARSGGGS
ncbi:hypothetical protein DC74_8158 [Streptomyces noursei]|nr:hypothetical protein DC74_8158 [Streptomyces noursei]